MSQRRTPSVPLRRDWERYREDGTCSRLTAADPPHERQGGGGHLSNASDGVGPPTANKPSGALAAAMFAARIVRQGHRPMKMMKQLPSVDVHHLMLVFVDAVTERAVVILEIDGSLRVGVLHWA